MRYPTSRIRRRLCLSLPGAPMEHFLGWLGLRMEETVSFLGQWTQCGMTGSSVSSREKHTWPVRTYGYVPAVGISSTAQANFIIAVSPWFSTHFNSKNWVFICENLPTLRWEQMLSLKPDLVEIISWNGMLLLLDLTC